MNPQAYYRLRLHPQACDGTDGGATCRRKAKRPTLHVGLEPLTDATADRYDLPRMKRRRLRHSSTQQGPRVVLGNLAIWQPSHAPQASPSVLSVSQSTHVLYEPVIISGWYAERDVMNETTSAAVLMDGLLDLMGGHALVGSQPTEDA